MANKRTKDASLNQQLQKIKQKIPQHYGCLYYQNKCPLRNKIDIFQIKKNKCPRKQSKLVISQHLHVDPFIKCEHNGIVDGHKILDAQNPYMIVGDELHD